MERRKFLESSAIGLGGFAMASAVVGSAPAEAAGEATQAQAASSSRSP